jgi:hypothetical protein
MSILTESQLATFDFARGFGMKTNSSEDVDATLNDVIPALGSAVIAGGMAVIHHGYERYTKDIDVLYAAADTQILKRFESAFNIDRQAAHGGWQYLTHKKTGIKLELIPEGGLTTYGFIPGPRTVGNEQEFVSLFGLIWLKLVAGRAQDDADIVVLAKLRLADVAAVRPRLPPELLPRFDELLARAKKELTSDKGSPRKP